MVLKKQYSMQNEALMSSWVPHGVPFGSCQQQEWSINGRIVHAMHYVRCNRSKKAGCPQSLLNTQFSVRLPTNEVPRPHPLGLYNSLSETLGHRTYEASALEEDSLIAALELTVLTGFQKRGISKSLLEAIGRMQVVRGIQKTHASSMLSARALEHSVFRFAILEPILNLAVLLLLHPCFMPLQTSNGDVKRA